MTRDTQIFDLIQKERERQTKGIELIASENFVSDQVMEAMGSVMTNKYAEGYPGKRYYGGCQIVDQSEQLAIDRAKELFGACWANVQPHSGAQANMAVFFACLNPGDTFMGLDLNHGGHLSHGSPVNISGTYFNQVSYGVKEETGTIDYDMMEQVAREHKPKLIIGGASAYSRDFDWKRMRALADEIGAILMGDISHPSGLIAKGELNNAVEYCHIVTTTTHKTLRGPRGGLILMGKDFENKMGIVAPKSGRVKMMSEIINGTVFPGIQGGPLMHVIAGKAVALKEALDPSFKDYQTQVVKNSQALAKKLQDFGFDLFSGGTDNHLMLINLNNKGVTGKQAEEALDKAGITVNKNGIPFDTQPPTVTGGLRVGTAALTTRGMKEAEMEKIAEWINRIISDIDNASLQQEIRSEVKALCEKFPIY